MMKIHSDPNIEAVRQQEQAKSGKQAEAKVSFGDLLGQEVAKTKAGEAPAAIAPPLRIDALLQTEATAEVSRAEMTESDVADQVASVLDQWDEYASHLASPADGSGLKQAYGVLENISEEMEGIKAAPAYENAPPALREIVDDLEAMAAAEQFKINRGDYL